MHEYRQMLDFSGEGFLVCDASGEVLYANSTAARLFGRGAARVDGMSLLRLAEASGIPVASDASRLLEGVAEISPSGDSGRGEKLVVEVAEHEPFAFDGQMARLYLVRDITERRRLEADVLGVSNLERERLAGDFHDTIGQEITGVTFKARALQSTLEQRLPEEAPALTEIIAHLAEAQEHARALSHGLAPAVDKLGLAALLQRLAETSTKLFRVPCSFTSNFNGKLERTAVVNLSRIAQEAVHNAIRHGQATSVQVELEAAGGALTLAIRDNGRGFSGARSGSGIGIRTMGYRAAEIGAEFEIEAAAEGGTVVTCKLPTVTSPGASGG